MAVVSEYQGLEKVCFMYDTQNGWFKHAQIITSPNFSQRPENSEIDAIILHSISMPLGCYEGDDISELFTNQLDWDKEPFYDKSLSQLFNILHHRIFGPDDMISARNLD